MATAANGGGAPPPPQGQQPQGAQMPWRTWQSDSDIPARKTLIHSILKLFQQRKPTVTKEWQQKLPDFVRRLEEALYRTARSADEYKDPNTLEQRMQAVLRRMVARPPGGGGAAGALPVQPGGVGGAAAAGGGGQVVPGHVPLGANGQPQPQQAQAAQQQQQQQQQAMHQQMQRQVAAPGAPGQGLPGQVPTPGAEFAGAPGVQQHAMRGMQLGAGGGGPGAGGGQYGGVQAPPGAMKSEAGGDGGMMGMMPTPGEFGGAGATQGSAANGGGGSMMMSNGAPIIRGAAAAGQAGQYGQVPAGMGQVPVGGGGAGGVQLRQGSSGGVPVSGSSVGAPGSTMVPVGGVGGPEDQARQLQMQQMQQQRSLVQKQQRWLLFLRHSSKCQAPEGQCPVTPHCGVARKLWKHVLECRQPKCEYPRCVPSRELLSHHQRCREPKCVVCAPVREALQRQRALAQQQQQQQSGAAPGQAAMQPGQQLGAAQLAGMTPAQQQQAIARAQAQRAAQAQAQAQQQMGGMMPTPHMPVPGQPMAGQAAAGKSRAPKRKAPADAKAQAAAQQAAAAQGAGKKVKTEAKLEETSIVDTFTADGIEQLLKSLRAEKPPPQAAKSKAAAAAAVAKVSTEPNDNMCQLCQQERLTFEPPPVYCSVCQGRVKRNMPYWTTSVGSEMGGGVKPCVCSACYSAAAGDKIKIDQHAVPKSTLTKKKNDEDVEEPWVACDKCGKWQHQVCALFNSASNRQQDGEGAYECPVCVLAHHRARERGQPMTRSLPAPKWPAASDLPRSKLTDFLEARLKGALERERSERAAAAGTSPAEVPTAEPLTLRMVSNTQKKVFVNDKFTELYPDFASELPYQSKVMLLFQHIEGIDVCIFAMYVQEYGEDCPDPNRRRVYLSYLDSVKYFRPNVHCVWGEHLRTFVYQEILCGYLDFVKRLGYLNMYIWACPPLSGEDYILHCHPDHQKTPIPKKLREWYLRMLAKSKQEGVVLGTSNLLEFYWSTGREQARASELPFFDGDFWAGGAHAMIAQIDADAAAAASKKGKKGGGGGKDSKKGAKDAGGAGGPAAGGAKTRRGYAGKVPEDQQRDAALMAKVAETIKPMKDDFILVHMAPYCACCRRYVPEGTLWTGTSANGKESMTLCGECHGRETALSPPERFMFNKGVWSEGASMSSREVEGFSKPKKEPDDECRSEFFDNRQQYLSLCQGNHYQFDQLRRAKHASMMTLYHLHNPQVAAFAATCNECGNEIDPGEGYRCTECQDFDLCAKCFGSVGHPHKMQAHSKNPGAGDAQRRERIMQQVQRTMQLLVHASACRNPQCPSSNCNKVKALFHHGVNCPTRVSGGCAICKRMWALLHLHARQCQSNQCPVPRCSDLKQTLRRTQQQMDDRRRAAVMQLYRNHGNQ